MWIMTIVLSSVPYGLGTTFCEQSSSFGLILLMDSLHPLERRCFGSHVGLDHHVDHLRLYRYLAW
jgi:hypothetical protein